MHLGDLWSPKNKLLMAVALAGGLVLLSAGAAQKLTLSSDDTVVVRADEAWEEPLQQIAHFRGDFRLQAPDWSIMADNAVLYGPLEDPDRVVVDGQPAVIRLRKADQITEVEGEGRHIEYRRDSDSLILSGDARLRDGGNTFSSGLIEYDIGADRFSAGDSDGVEVIVKPQKD